METKIDLIALKNGFVPFDIAVPNNDDLTMELIEDIILKNEMDEDEFCMDFASFAKNGNTPELNLESLRNFEAVLAKRKQNSKHAKNKSLGSGILTPRTNLAAGNEKAKVREMLSLYAGVDVPDTAVEPIMTPKIKTRPEKDEISEPMDFTPSIDSPISQNPYSTPPVSRPTTGEFSKTPKCSKLPHTAGTFTPRGAPKPSTSGIKTKADHGKIVEKYGVGIPSSSKPLDYQATVTQTSKLLSHAINEPYKYMVQKSSDVAELLSDRIEEITEQIINQYDLARESFVSVRKPCQDLCYVSGMICNEESSGRLSANSVILQGSSECSLGHCVKLDLSESNDCSVFPGQVAVFEGRNPTGKEFIVVRQIYGRPSIIEPILPSEHESMSVCVAGGPFTTSDGYDYEPLYELLKRTVVLKPQLLILVGPFVDVEQKWVARSLLECSFQELFERVMVRMGEMLSTLSTQVFIIPHGQRDVHIEPIHPSAPFRTQYFSAKRDAPNVHFMPDPCSVRVEGVTIACSSLDIIRQLSGEEISRGGANNSLATDRMGRLVKHLFRQKQLYPVYPTPEGLSIEYDMAKDHGAIHSSPHLLITPSDVRPFIKNVEGVVALNPGRLCKENYGGTFAELNINLEKAKGNSIAECTDGQIVKIF